MDSWLQNKCSGNILPNEKGKRNKVFKTTELDFYFFLLKDPEFGHLVLVSKLS